MWKPTTMNRASTVDEYIVKSPQWAEELMLLRSILLTTELKEEVKWGGPIYTLNGKNVVGIGAFKAYVGLWFHQGVFLKDEAGVLVNAAEGKTKGLRQWRFQSMGEIDPKLVSKYVEEAIENQKAGKEIKPEPKKEVEFAEELAAALKDDALRKAFEALTAAAQREYKEYIQAAKRPETRVKRVEKITPLILEGVGLNDKYRK